MSDNLGITRLPQGAETPELMINAALSEIDAFLSDSVEVDLSAANANLSLATIKAGNFISLNGAAEARTVLLPQTKRTLFFKNYGTAEVTVTRGTKSVAIPAGQARTMRLTGAENGLEDIGGGGSGGGSGGLPEAPTDGKYYARKSATWAEVPAAGGSPGVAPNFAIWRLYGTIRSGKNQIGISTFNINNAVTNSIPVTASSTENSTSYPANNARPGTSGSWYSMPSTDTNPWIEYTFPAPIAGDSIYLYHDTSNQQYMPASIRLEARNSTSDPWTVVIPTTPHTPTNPGGDASYGIPRVVEGGSSGGIEEAPTDGKQYARQNEAWTEVVATGSGSGGIGPYPIEPPTTASLPLEFKSGSSVVATLVDNPRGFLIRRTGIGNQYVDTNYERMMSINPANDFTLDCIIKPPAINRGNYTRYGLALRESATDKHLYYYFATESNSPQIARLFATNIQGAGASFSNLKSYSFSDCYFRIVKTSAGYQLQFSENYGITFTTLVTIPLTTAFTAQANQVGLIAQAYGNYTDPMDLVCPYFKFTQA